MTEKEQLSTTQPGQTQNFRSPAEDEINLIDALEFLLKNKVLILATTSIFTLFSLLITPSKVAIAVLKPTETFLLAFPEQITQQLADSAPYSQFLSTVTSFSHKKEVFEQGDFLEKFYGSSNTDSIENPVLELHNSISLSPVKINKELPDFEKPVYLTMMGHEPAVMSEFLTELVKSAKEETIASIRELSRLIINAKVNSISAEINNFGLATEEKRAKDIMFLSEAVKIANNLSIQNNNFDTLSKQDLRVEIQRTLDQNSQTRRENTLKRYKATDPSLLDIKVVTISQPAIAIKSKTRVYVIAGMVSGLFIGIVIASMRNSIDRLKQRRLSITSIEKP